MISKELLKIAKELISAPMYPIDAQATFWDSVYLSAFPNRQWKTQPLNETLYRSHVREFITKLETILKNTQGKRFFYSHIQYKIKSNKDVECVVIIEEKGKKTDINLYFGAVGHFEGKVYVDGSYQSGRDRSMASVAGEIIRVYELIKV